MTRIYLDGIFDMFHRGHLESFKQCKELGDYLIVGIISNKDASDYKRSPIINQEDRAEIIKYCSLVDEIIEEPPMKLDKNFLEKYKIDYVVHGFADNDDFNKQKKYYQHLIDIGKFKQIKYYSKTSTTKIINKCNNL